MTAIVTILICLGVAAYLTVAGAVWRRVEHSHRSKCNICTNGRSYSDPGWSHRSDLVVESLLLSCLLWPVLLPVVLGYKAGTPERKPRWQRKAEREVSLAELSAKVAENRHREALALQKAMEIQAANNPLSILATTYDKELTQ